MSWRWLIKDKDTVAELRRKNASLRLLVSIRQRRSAVGGRACEEQHDAAFGAVAWFLRSRAVAAIAAVASSSQDLGHIRDLADSAVCGDADAALVLAELTLEAKHVRGDVQLVEGVTWLTLACQFGEKRGWLAAAEAQLAQVQDELDSEMNEKITIAFEYLLSRHNQVVSDASKWT